MIKTIEKIRFLNLALLWMLLLIHPSQSSAASYEPSENRAGFSMTGGYAHADTMGAMIDLNLEFQFSLSSRMKVGLGAGYLSGNDDMHMSGKFVNMPGGMMGGMNEFMWGGFSGHRHNMKTIPVTLSLYYILPLNHKFDVFMMGGGGYYFASYKDRSTQKKSSFGPHFGFGLNFRVSGRIAIVAQGIYRFVSLDGFMSELHEGFLQDLESGEHVEGFWHFHYRDEAWHFHEEHESEQQTLYDVAPFDISLNGIALRVGIRFLF